MLQAYTCAPHTPNFQVVSETSARQAQGRALGWQEIKEFIGSAGQGLRPDRERALLCVAYETLARRSELVALDVGDVEILPDGTGRALIRRGKTDAEGQGRVAYLSRETMKQFGLERLVLVGDRGMISHKAIKERRTLDGLAWITALKSSQIGALVQGGELQLGLFDERDLFEFSHPEYPGERLMACRNVDLGKLRAHKGQALLEATEKELDKVRARIENGSLAGRDRIDVRVGKVVDKYKVGKHFALTIEESDFQFTRLESQIAAEAALDGLYVIRTSVPKQQMTSADAVRSYKALAEVERAFRSMKTIDLHIRPIHHRLEGRVRAHIFLCMLAYYVEWHMREAWRELMFADEDLERKQNRDPVAAAERSEAALEKVATRKLKNGSPVHSFRTLLYELSTIVRNTCEARVGRKNGSTFQMTTLPNPAQQRALQLLQKIAV